MPSTIRNEIRAKGLPKTPPVADHSGTHRQKVAYHRQRAPWPSWPGCLLLCSGISSSSRNRSSTGRTTATCLDRFIEYYRRNFENNSAANRHTRGLGRDGNLKSRRVSAVEDGREKRRKTRGATIALHSCRFSVLLIHRRTPR